MKWTTTTALILAAGAGALALNHVLSPRAEDPTALLARLDMEERTGIADGGEALRQLAAAIDADGALDDPETAIALLRARAARLRAIGAHGPARDDLERVLATWLPGNQELELEVAELMALEGRTEDALRRMQRLVTRDETNAAAHELLGRLEQESAKVHVEEAIRRALGSVTFKGVARAKAIIEEASARDESDPRTAELVAELRQMFKPHEQAPTVEVPERMRDARSANARARDAFARAMSLAPSETATVAIADTLDRIGRTPQALDLLLASRAIPKLSRSAVVVASALPMLERSGQLARAREIVSSWDWTWGGDLEFYRLAATTLYRAGEFLATHQAATAMSQAGGDLARYWTIFYFAAAGFSSIEAAVKANPNFEYDVEAIQGTIRALSSFARNTVELEPFEGARVEAWRLVARAHRLLGEDEGERIALATALQDSTEPRADDWARIAELEARAPQPAWERVEARLAKAMDAEPKRTAEFLPRWVNAGDRALAAEGLDFAEVLQECRSQADGEPLRSVGTSVRWRLAQTHVSEGRTDAGVGMVERLLEEFPNLVPALDTRIEAQLATRAPFLVVDDILRRVELMGTDARTEAFLADLAEPLQGEQLTRAMRAAPGRFGRPAAAELAMREGDPTRAAELLAPVEAVVYSPELKLLRGRYRVAAGHLAAAREDLEPLLGHPQHGAAALGLLLDIRLEQGDRPAVEALVERASRELLDAPARLALVELLLTHGRTDLAEQLLALLDQTLESRTPAFYRTLVRFAALTRDPGRQTEAIARAEPFLVDGTPELAELLVHVGDRDWTKVPTAVERLRATEFQPTPIQEAALALLEERLANGRRLIERGVASQPRSPEWALLRAAALALEGEPIVLAPWFGQRAAAETTDTLTGNRFGRRDPRETLAVLLTLELDAWAPWVASALQRLEEQRAGRLWPLWLRVRLEQQRREIGAALTHVATLEKEFADFGPAWELHLADLRRKHVADPLAPELLTARVARLGALGEQTLEDPVDIALSRASKHILDGEVQLAMAELGRALDREERDDFDAHFTRGALLASFGQHGLAVKPLRAAAASAPPAAANAASDALVAATIKAANPAFEQRGVIPVAELPARLEDIVRLFPTDPLAAAALVRHGLDPAAGPTQRAALARRELARLRRESKGQPLESLRRGSVRAWVDLTLDVAPELARELLVEELRARPGDVEVWELSATTEQRFGSADEALALYATVLAIEPRPRASHAYAEMRLRNGAPDTEVERYLASADRALGGPRSARSRVITTLMLARQSLPRFDLIAAELSLVWSQRERLDGSLSATDVGFMLASTYLQWAGDLAKWRALASSEAPPAWLPAEMPTEKQLAEQALEVLGVLAPTVEQSAYLKPLCDSYLGIAQNLRG